MRINILRVIYTLQLFILKSEIGLIGIWNLELLELYEILILHLILRFDRLPIPLREFRKVIQVNLILLLEKVLAIDRNNLFKNIRRTFSTHNFLPRRRLEHSPLPLHFLSRLNYLRLHIRRTLIE